jgi:hypothetical protein
VHGPAGHLAPIASGGPARAGGPVQAAARTGWARRSGSPSGSRTLADAAINCPPGTTAPGRARPLPKAGNDLGGFEETGPEPGDVGRLVQTVTLAKDELSAGSFSRFHVSASMSLMRRSLPMELRRRLLDQRQAILDRHGPPASVGGVQLGAGRAHQRRLGVGAPARMGPATTPAASRRPPRRRSTDTSPCRSRTSSPHAQGRRKVAGPRQRTALPTTLRGGHPGNSRVAMSNQTSNQLPGTRWTRRGRMDGPAREVPAQRHPLDAPTPRVRGTHRS